MNGKPIWQKILLAILAPFASRKLWMVTISIFFVSSLYWTSLWYLYSFTEQWKAELFYKMYASTAISISGIVFGYLGFQTLAGIWSPKHD